MLRARAAGVLQHQRSTVPSNGPCKSVRQLVSLRSVRSPHDCTILITDISATGREPPYPHDLTRAKLVSLQDRIRPFVVTAPQNGELSPENLRWKAGGTLAKERRAAPAVAQHDRIAASPDTYCIYTDGSVRAESLAGCGAIIPSLGQASMRHLDVLEHTRRTLLAEFHGLVLGMEMAATHVPPGSRIAIFTDGQMDRSFVGEEWDDAHVRNAYAKADAALRTLEEQGSKLSIYWVPGHRGTIDGIILAHRIASYASQVSPEAMSRLLLAPVYSAGVAFDHTGVLGCDRHQFYIPAYPRRRKAGGAFVDGMSTVNAYKGIREPFLRLSSEKALSHRISAIAHDPPISS